MFVDEALDRAVGNCFSHDVCTKINGKHDLLKTDGFEKNKKKQN